MNWPRRNAQTSQSRDFKRWFGSLCGVWRPSFIPSAAIMRLAVKEGILSSTLDVRTIHS